LQNKDVKFKNDLNNAFLKESLILCILYLFRAYMIHISQQLYISLCSASQW